MTWFLLNMPLAVLFILAWTLIPLWLVSRHPDTPPETSPSRDNTFAASAMSVRADPRVTSGLPSPGSRVI